MKFNRLTVIAITTSNASAFGPGLVHNRRSLKNVFHRNNRGMSIKMADEIIPDPLSVAQEPMIVPETETFNVAQQEALEAFRETPGPLALDEGDETLTRKEQKLKDLADAEALADAKRVQLQEDLASAEAEMQKLELESQKVASQPDPTIATGAAYLAVPAALLIGARSLLENTKDFREDKARQSEINKLVAEQDARNKAKASSKGPFGAIVGTAGAAGAAFLVAMNSVSGPVVDTAQVGGYNLDTSPKTEVVKIAPKNEDLKIPVPVSKIQPKAFVEIKTPEPKLEVKPEPKPAPVVEVKKEPAPAPVVEVKPEPKPAPVVEVKKEPAPAPVVEVKPEPKPAPVVEVKPEPKPAPVVEVKPEPKPAPVVEVKPEPKPAPVVEVKKEPAPAPVVEVKKEPAPAPVVEAKKPEPAPVPVPSFPPAPVPSPSFAPDPSSSSLIPGPGDVVFEIDANTKIAAGSAAVLAVIGAALAGSGPQKEDETKKAVSSTPTIVPEDPSESTEGFGSSYLAEPSPSPEPPIETASIPPPPPVQPSQPTEGGPSFGSSYLESMSPPPTQSSDSGTGSSYLDSMPQTPAIDSTTPPGELTREEKQKKIEIEVESLVEQMAENAAERAAERTAEDVEDDF